MDSRETFRAERSQKTDSRETSDARKPAQKDSRETHLKHEVPRQPSSLPDAEAAEDLVEHVLHIHAPRDPAQRIRRAAKILGAKLHII